MKTVNAPPFLNNLYRDMRDRRLLFPALALLVALIAVPVLLKSSASTAPPPAAAVVSTDAGDQSAAEPAVLAEQAGITNYRRRLEWPQSKDPFRSRVPAPSTASTQAASSTAGTAASTSLGTGSTTVTSTTSSSVSGSTGSTTTTTTSSSSPSSGGTNSTATSSHKTPKPGWFAFRVSVAVGPAGDLTERNSVQRLVFLPGDNRPVVAFIGVSEDGKRAIFMVSDHVSSVRGDGRCIPRRGLCNYLELKPGDKASLRYEPEGDRTYNLKLRKIELVSVGKPHASVSGKRGTQPLLGPDG